MEELTFNQKIVRVQSELKAPKGQFNSFGNFKYRSCEDILEAVKPLLATYDLVLKIEDDIVLIGDRYYIKATAMVTDGIQSLTTSAFAREPKDKKGMDEAQITGATSSYARKYALNGLFAIDDARDADSDDNSEKSQEKVAKVEKPQTKQITKKQYDILNNLDLKYQEGACRKFKVEGLKELTEEQAQYLIDGFTRTGVIKSE